MNYQKIYNSLIDRANIRTPETGFPYERHHIIPRCMGGLNSSNNIAILTPEEHYLAHQLLVKIYPDDRRLIKAANRMTTGKHRNNKLYGWLRRRHSESMTGENNSFYGKKHTPGELEKMRIGNLGKIQTEEAKRKISVAKSGILRSDETKRKVSESKKVSILTPRTKISTPDGIFDSIIEAAKFYDRHSATIISKLDSIKDIHRNWFRM